MKHISRATTNDIIMNSQGSKCKVITGIDTLIARSCFYPRYDVFSEWITVEDLERGGWKVLSGGWNINGEDSENLPPILERWIAEEYIEMLFSKFATPKIPREFNN